MKIDWLSGVLTPLISNILTGIIFFSAAFFFKDPIYQFFRDGMEAYPIYCIAEPFQSDQGAVFVELFIINKTNKHYSENELTRFLFYNKDNQNSDDPYLRISVKDRGLGSILNIIEKPAINQGKGKIIIVSPEKSDGNWKLLLTEISARGIIRLQIMTDYKNPVISRSTPELAPIEIVYPGI